MSFDAPVLYSDGGRDEMEDMRALIGEVQHYDWGSTTAIPRILGVEPDGRPWAELWLGAHPTAPSKLDDTDGPTLDRVLESDPSGIGTGAVDAFGPRLPFLLKILAAKQALSLQTHPSREQAEAGFAREEAEGIPRDARERLYVDDWPKPEIMVALEEFHALCGFRDPIQTADMFTALGEVGPDRLGDVLAPLRDPDTTNALRETFTSVLQLTSAQVEAFVALAAEHTDAPEPVGQFARTAVELAADYPGDPGVIAALLMNRIVLHPGDAVFLEADVMHAYLRGAGIELMANSNNVLRGGLTPKHVDVPELSRMVHFEPYTPRIFRGTETGTGLTHYEVPVPEFTLWRIDADNEPVEVPATERGRILLVTSGTASVQGPDTELATSPGQAVWLAAGEQASVRGVSTAWVAASGI
ncbi:mannose-6-phosphate isomerase, class I [Enemella sp. A6]|uniref:mannose-6-phosphate isomerase, class I n=1 Tax=Enemella sp. A6 TaxID=3440152 RepID=UPI003EB8240F